MMSPQKGRRVRAADASERILREGRENPVGPDICAISDGWLTGHWSEATAETDERW
jgi:hypothetical protein